MRLKMNGNHLIQIKEVNKGPILIEPKILMIKEDFFMSLGMKKNLMIY